MAGSLVCTGCTHLKRHRSDLLAEGAVLGHAQDVAGLENENANSNMAGGNEDQPAFLHPPPQQDALPAGSPRGYVRLAVMDTPNSPFVILVLSHVPQNPTFNGNANTTITFHVSLFQESAVLSAGSMGLKRIMGFTVRRSKSPLRTWVILLEMRLCIQLRTIKDNKVNSSKTTIFWA
ncbi:hypothetical protein B0H13DRAFT_1926077 [Mycena leptocephala]|nr:hypothetical protein B0H13DRAFT_1926077 [Mycena leptocephala]